MATTQSETIRNRVYSGGAHGNFSIAFGKATLDAVAIDDVVQVLEIPAGLKFVGVRLSTEAGLGTSVTVTAQVGDEVLASAADMAAAGASVSVPCVPFSTTETQYLTVTIAGAAATGDLNVIPEYVVVGTI